MTSSDSFRKIFFASTPTVFRLEPSGAFTSTSRRFSASLFFSSDSTLRCWALATFASASRIRFRASSFWFSCVKMTHSCDLRLFPSWVTSGARRPRLMMNSSLQKPTLIISLIKSGIVSLTSWNSSESGSLVQFIRQRSKLSKNPILLHCFRISAGLMFGKVTKKFSARVCTNCSK